MRFPSGLRTHRRVKGSVWAIAMVRNEADIIGGTVEHLFRQGVDQILVADNGSTDDTVAILNELATRLPMVIGVDAEAAYYQAQKMTYLARVAARCGADWIVPFDADEWWFGAAGERLVDTLRGAPSGVATASLYNCFPVLDSEQQSWGLDVIPHPSPKVAFTWQRNARLQEGNHWVHHSHEPHLALNIVHFPWRSYGQFERKVRQGAAAVEAAGGGFKGGDHWRILGQLTDADLRKAWRALLEGDAPESFEWVPRGTLRLVDPRSWRVWPGDLIRSDSRRAT